MALTKDAVFEKNGFSGKLVAKNAYWKIDKISGNKESITFEIRAIVDGEIVAKFNSAIVPKLNSSNFIAQAYDHLKTLPEFAGAVDC